MTLKRGLVFIFFCLAVIVVALFAKTTANKVISPASMVPDHIVSAPTHIPSPTSSPEVQIGLVGDLGLGRHITSTARAKDDFSWSFSGVSPWLTANDFNIANLESPVTDPCPEGRTGTFTFCGDKRFLPQLSLNKFVLNLSNNHMLNYGQKGLAQTYDFLDSLQIPYYYSHQSDKSFITKKVNGITFGFLGYDFVTYPPSISQGVASSDLINELVDKVIQHDNQVDWLVVSLHWGNEYLPKAESWRVDLAHKLIDAGADIIHGHHPHVIQPSEIYKNKPIFYSLGNFIFDQSWSYETSHSLMVRLKLSKTGIIDTDTVPITIKNNSRPEID